MSKMLGQNIDSMRVLMCLALALICMHVDGVDIIEADYSSRNPNWVTAEAGRLLLLRTEPHHHQIWKILDITNDNYITASSEAFFECYRKNYANYYGSRCSNSYSNRPFRPINLTIRSYPREIIPIGLLQSSILSELRHFRISGLDVPIFYASMLNGANSLQTLDLSHNALQELPAKVFANAANLIEINLSYNQIAWMPSDVFMDETLSASTTPPNYNSEASSNEEDFHDMTTPANLIQPLQKLRIIRLNNNYLTFIDPFWFLYLKSLETVVLNNNLFTEVDVFSVFIGNLAIRSIYLQNNNFSNIATNGFKAELDSFDISNNPENSGKLRIQVNAKTINISNTNSEECFIPYSAVILHADHNRINSVTVNEIPNTNLRELYLDHNNIDSAEFLSGLESVESIDLSHNALTQISLNVLDNLKNLTTLNISFNKLATIDFAFIKPATSLTHLDVSNNLLSGHFHLDVEAKALATLNIANNNYTSVQQNLKNHAPNLTSIDLNGNYFDCDYLTSTILFLNFDHIRTITPIEDAPKTTDTNNVKGINCYNTRSDSELVNERISHDSLKRNNNAIKNDVNKSLDDKLTQLEARLIELVKNITGSKVQDNKV